MLGLEEAVDFEVVQTGPTYEGTDEDLELLESLSREKNLLILEKLKNQNKIYLKNLRYKAIMREKLALNTCCISCLVSLLVVLLFVYIIPSIYPPIPSVLWVFVFFIVVGILIIWIFISDFFDNFTENEKDQQDKESKI